MINTINLATSKMQRFCAYAFLSLFVMLLSACGFHMRHAVDVPYKTVYTNISNNSAFGANLLRLYAVNATGIRYVDTAKEADIQLIQLANTRQQTAISLDANGKIEEYQLDLNYTFEVLDKNAQILLPPISLTASRQMPYDETKADSEATEMQMLYQDMESTVISRMIRRLTSEELINAYNQSRQNTNPKVSQ